MRGLLRVEIYPLAPRLPLFEHETKKQKDGADLVTSPQGTIARLFVAGNSVRVIIRFI